MHQQAEKPPCQGALPTSGRKESPHTMTGAPLTLDGVFLLTSSMQRIH